MNDSGILRLPSEVRFGRGIRSLVPGIVARLGQRAFIVADPFLASTTEFAAVSAALSGAGVATRVYVDVAPELPTDSLGAAAAAAREFEPDVVVGYGGGSALDASKLVALQLAFDGPLSGWYGENLVPGPVLPIVAIPTTAGTGSEVTPVAVISDPDRQMKVGISSPYLVPTVAIVDPELSVGAPASVTAYAGIDALVHAVESYTASALLIDPGALQPVSTGRNVLTNPLSLDAVRHIGGSLETAVTSPTNSAARESMAYGSLVAGMAFGSTGVHLSHALQYPIGAATHTPHGLGTGLMLPFVLAASLPTARDRIADIGTALGLTEGADLAERTIERIANLGQAIGLPSSLAELGIERSELPNIAELALQSRRLVSISPVPATHELLVDILESAYIGHPAASAR